VNREVMERDLRAAEYREGKPDEYEFRSDGKIVRKDRFQCGMRDIAAIVFGCGHDYEIADVVKAIHGLQGVRLAAALNMARDVFESEPKALEAIEYLKAVLDTQKEGK
jgi:hypothetical protein